MSHIPASAMPHAKAHDDDIDGQAPQPNQAQPAPEPTTAVPPASTSDARPAKEAASVDDGATAAPAPTDKPRAHGDEDRSPIAIAAMVIGGLAVVGGLVAALLPLLTSTDEPKARKRKKRKAA